LSEYPFLRRVVIKNYRSIAGCDVRLRPLTMLVGRNGSGKSNFLDALRFVADALNTSLNHALRDRGGVNEVRRRSGGHPTHFGIRLDLTLPTGASGHYAFRVAARARGAYEVQEEECEVSDQTSLGVHRFHVGPNGVSTNLDQAMPPALPDRLYLVNAGGLAQFRPVYDALSAMGFYNLNPDRIRDLQSPDPGTLLARDGSNLSSVLGQLRDHRPEAKSRVEGYLANVTSNITGVDVRVVGPRETLEFRQQVSGSRDPWRFPAAAMSDGTLRALGILVALFQYHGGDSEVPLVGIEEPEAALHPGAAGVLLDALREASVRTQVVVTSHSPDLLDDATIDADSILTVALVDGSTVIGQVDETGRSILRDRLFTAGELLRLDQLSPSDDAKAQASGSQLDLFETPSRR
jgi:predicted ATPase